MATKVSSRRWPRKNGCDIRAPKHARIDEVAARALNMRPATVHNHRFGPRPWHECLTEVLRAAVPAEDWQEIERLLEPIRDALRGPGQDDINTLRHRAQMADIEEDVAEERVRANDTKENRIAHLRALRKQNATSTKYAAALAAFMALVERILG